MTQGRLKSGAVTLAQVAELAGVSAITVSRAVRQLGSVSPEARARVEAAIRSLSYTPNIAARALASVRTDVIGVIISSVTNSVFAEVLRGIYEAPDGQRFQIQLGNSDYSPLEEARLLRIFQSQKPAGLIVTGIDQSDDGRGLLSRMGCPVVQIMETGPDPFDMLIGFSHYDSGALAATHLAERGYRRIGLIGARMDPRTLRRFNGFRDALTGRQLYHAERIVSIMGPSSVEVGSRLLAELLTQAPDTDAVFCINDDLAMGALFECQRRSLNVPDTMGIVGFNDFEAVSVTVPALTSVRTHRYEMGQRAIAMLAAAIAGQRPADPVVDLGATLIARASTARSV